MATPSKGKRFAKVVLPTNKQVGRKRYHTVKQAMLKTVEIEYVREHLRGILTAREATKLKEIGEKTQIHRTV